MKQAEPIHAAEKDKALPLIGKPILFAAHKEGLGTYGTLVGWDRRGFFVVTPDHNPEVWFKCAWIVEY